MVTRPLPFYLTHSPSRKKLFFISAFHEKPEGDQEAESSHCEQSLMLTATFCAALNQGPSGFAEPSVAMHISVPNDAIRPRVAVPSNHSSSVAMHDETVWCCSPNLSVTHARPSNSHLWSPRRAADCCQWKYYMQCSPIDLFGVRRSTRAWLSSVYTVYIRRNIFVTTFRVE